jgi:steroid 5-alpha reductase family enzyme
VLAILSLPFLLVCLNPRPGLAPVEWAGIVLWLIAVAGESLADYQLKQFKGNPASRGQVCQIGLWHYSRHPNYFFEWLIWMSFFIFALGSPWGILTAYCPALMLFFLIRVTGIPMTEDLAVKTKGEEYRQYQETTSMFVPWFRRKAAARLK